MLWAPSPIFITFDLVCDQDTALGKCSGIQEGNPTPGPSLSEKPFPLLGPVTSPTSKAGLLGPACHRVLGCGCGMSQVRGRAFLGTCSAVGYLLVYTKMEGVASVAGGPVGSLSSRRASWLHNFEHLRHCGRLEKNAGVCRKEREERRRKGRGERGQREERVERGEERERRETCLHMPPLVTVTRLVWDLQQGLREGGGVRQRP